MHQRIETISPFYKCSIKYLRLALIFIFAVLVSQKSFSQLQFNATGTQTIDFSNTVSGVNNGAFNGSGVVNVPGAGKLDSDGWEFTGWSDPNITYGGSAITGDYARNVTNVAVTTGGLYAFTGAPGSAANPALMVQAATNDFTPGSITLRIQNTSGASVLTQINVSYKLFCRNDGGRSSYFNLQWSSDNITYTDVPAGAYTSPGAVDVLGWQQVFNPAISITGLSVIGGGYFYLRWKTDDSPSTPSGTRDEFGLDDIAVTATFVSCASPPTTNASITSILPITGTSATVNFTRGNGTGGMLAVVSPAALGGNPVNGVNYSGNTNYGDGAALSNGFVVYFGNAITAGNSGSFTITGLTAGANYIINLFEYNSSGPCYTVPGVNGNFTTTGTTNAAITNYYRAKASGSWALPTNWEFSPDGITYSALPCDRTPTYLSNGIIIPSGITIDVNSTISLDQTVLGGTLRLVPSGKMSVYNGTGTDLSIQGSGVFQVMTNDGYSTAILYPSGTPEIAVASGGIIRIGAGGSVGAGYSGLASGASQPTSWNTGAVFDWNSTEAFQTATLTYFNGAAPAVVPIFRVSKTPSLIPGASSTTIWNGVMEINSPLTLRLPGDKYFRNGITGSSVLTSDESCGNIFIGDQSATVTATLSVPTINLGDNSNIYVVANCTTNVLGNVVVNRTVTANGINVNNGGVFNCNAYLISGSGIFSLVAGGTIYSGHAQGIASSGATGNIQVTGTRTFDAGANYRYTGTTNQVTGNGLPATHASLTIANTGAVANNIVTLTTNNSSSTSLTLLSGLFAIGTGQNYIIPSAGTCAASGGDFATGSPGGTLNFTSGGTITGGVCSPYNLYVGNGGLTCPSSPGRVTIQAAGSFRINSGGWLAGALSNSIYYTAGSFLEYNSGGSYSSGIEWIQSANGAGSRGGPSNVTVLASGTQLQLNGGGTQIMTGNLLVKTGTQFALNATPGRDLTIGGNWTREAGSVFINNQRKVTFNGLADQTITLNGGGAENFALIRIDKGTTYLKLAAAPNATSVLLSGSNGAANSLEFIKGHIDLQQNDFNFNINFSNTQTNNIQIDGTVGNPNRNIISTGGPAKFICYNSDNGNSRLMVISKPGANGQLVFGNTVTLTAGGLNAGGIDFGTGSLATINGTFQLNSFGFTQNNPPKYGAGSYLIYNTGGMYRRNVEWQTADPGVPYNVSLTSANTHVYLNTAMNGNAARTVQASLRIFTGATLSMDGEAGNYYGDILTVADSVYIAGTLELANSFGGDMFVGKNWKRVAGGIFTDNLREVEFNGSANSLIEGSGGETFSYISVNKTGSYFAQCNSAINVTRRLRIPGGILKLDNNDVTLKSAAIYTAYLDVVPAATSINYSGTGRFVVERFIATNMGGYPYHKKSWQLLSVPVNEDVTGQTVNQAWQEGQLPGVVGASGLGTIITNNVAGTGGFDLVQGVGPSMKTYVPGNNTWLGISGTGIPHYNANGYMIFIRGDRNVQAYNANPTITILRTRGKVFAPGRLPAAVSVPNGKFQTAGNPYPAPIKFSLLSLSKVSGNKFYVWDPRLTTGSAYGLGAYQTFSFDGTNYRVSPGGGSYGAINSICDTIQSGQAFFVQSDNTGVGSVSFSEAAKAGGYRLVARAMAPQSVQNPQHFLGVKVYVNTQGTMELIDGTVSQFASRFSNSVDDRDAMKIPNTGENFSIITDGTLLAAEKMNIPRNGDEIQYNLGQFRVNTYQLEFIPENMQFNRLSAYLEDRYLHSFSPVSLSDTTWYSFSVDASASESYAANRFRIVFKKGGRLQIQPYLYSINNADGSILVCTPRQVAHEGYFELLAQINGNTTLVNRADAGLGIYQWAVPRELEDASFMVKYSSNDATEFSNQVKMDKADKSSLFTIYPNPVSSGQITVSAAGMEEMEFNQLSFSLTDASGKELQKGKLPANANQTGFTIRLGSSITSGVYRLTINRNGTQVAARQVLVIH